MDAQERKNRAVGIWTSIGVHVVTLAILFFVVAWRAPDPPLPEYGIELNFGLDDQGSGDVQPEQEVGDLGETANTEKAQETEPQETETSPEKSDEAATEKAVEPPVSKAESPVTVKETDKPAVTAKETVKPETTYQKKETATKPTSEAAATTDASKKGDAASHGDDKNKTGDKGSEEGKVDAKALYGTPGGGGGGDGLNFSMSGWDWADKPEIPQLPDNADGRVVFEIECDENGDITGIKTLERTLSPKAEQLLKEMIRKNSLVRTPGSKTAPSSKGIVAFTLRTH